MSHNHDAIDAVPSEVDDLDVEGHGMKEVALGLSAATMVVAGGSAVLAADQGPLGGTASGARAAVQAVDQLRQGAVDDANRLTAQTQATADRLAQTGVAAVSPVGQAAHAAVQDVATTAGTAAGSALDRANATIADPIGATDRLADQTLKDARDLRDSAVDVALQTAGTGVEAASSTTAEVQTVVQRTGERAGTEVNEAQQLAGRATDRAGAYVASTTSDAKKLADAGVELAKDVIGEDTGASVTRSGGSTTVKATAAGHTTEVTVR